MNDTQFEMMAICTQFPYFIRIYVWHIGVSNGELWQPIAAIFKIFYCHWGGWGIVHVGGVNDYWAVIDIDPKNTFEKNVCNYLFSFRRFNRQKTNLKVGSHFFYLSHLEVDFPVWGHDSLWTIRGSLK